MERLRKLAAAALLAVVIWGSQNAMADEWSDTDTALLLAALAATAADVETTKRDIAKSAHETSPLLPGKASNSKVNAAGLLAALAGTTAAAKVPTEYRSALLGAWIGVELGLAAQNNTAHKGTFTDGLKKPLIAAAIGGALAHHFAGPGFSVGMDHDGLLALNLIKKF